MKISVAVAVKVAADTYNIWEINCQGWEVEDGMLIVYNVRDDDIEAVFAAGAWAWVRKMAP